MMVMTAKVNLKKVMIALAAVAALIVALILLLGGGGDSAETSAPTASSNDGRVKFLTDLGWDVTTSPTDSSQVRIPAASSDVFERYNALQKSQGYDLSEYAGKKVMRYVYKINNYPRRYRAGLRDAAGLQKPDHRRRRDGHRRAGKDPGLQDAGSHDCSHRPQSPHGDRRHRAGDDPVNTGKQPRFYLWYHTIPLLTSAPLCATVYPN